MAKVGVMRNEGYYNLLGAVIKSAMMDYARIGTYLKIPKMPKSKQLSTADSFIDNIEGTLEWLHMPKAQEWGAYIKQQAKEMKKLGKKQKIVSVYTRGKV